MRVSRMVTALDKKNIEEGSIIIYLFKLYLIASLSTFYAGLL